MLVEPGHVDRQKIRLEVAVSGRQWVDAVEGDDHGLSIFQIKEDVLLEQRLLMFLVLLRGRDGALAGRSAATEPTDTGMGRALGDGIADAGAVRLVVAGS